MRLKILTQLIFFLFVSCSINQSNKKAKIAEELNKQVRIDSVELHVLSAVGMRQVMLDLVPRFEEASGYAVVITINSSGEIVNMIDSAKYDVVIIFRPNFENLVKTERVIINTQTDLAMASVGVAVRKGAPKPDISSPEAFKRALLDAKSIACPDPARGGASGVHIATIFERLDIADALRSKLVLSSTPQDEKTMPGYLVAAGKAEIALHQIQELMAVSGIEIVGPLPDDLQATFVFTAAVTKNSRQVNIAKTFIQFLTTPEARALIKRKGMEPVDSSAK